MSIEQSQRLVRAVVAAQDRDPVLDASGDEFNRTFHKCRAEVSRDLWDMIWRRAVGWAWANPPLDAASLTPPSVPRLLTREEACDAYAGVPWLNDGASSPDWIDRINAVQRKLLEVNGLASVSVAEDRSLLQRIEQIAGDFVPGNNHEAPLALQEMRDALLELVASVPVAEDRMGEASEEGVASAVLKAIEGGPCEADCAMCKGRGFYGSPGGRCTFCKGTGRVKWWSRSGTAPTEPSDAADLRWLADKAILAARRDQRDRTPESMAAAAQARELLLSALGDAALSPTIKEQGEQS